MRNSLFSRCRGVAHIKHGRRGNILVLSAAVLVSVIAFTAFTVDIGYITLTKAQLQSAADAASLSAAMELQAGLSLGPTLSTEALEALARQSGVNIAAQNRAADVDSVYADGERDIRLGRFEWDAVSGSWQRTWGIPPYNMAEVMLLRGEELNGEGLPNTGGDRPLPLFFAPVIGHQTADVTVRATAALLPGVGFRLVSGSPQTAGVLPITLDESTWNDLLAGIAPDEYSYNPDTGQITPGADGILEANLYPIGSSLLPPGNRGTVDLGSPDNSTNDLKRQILDGLNDDDLSFFGGELRTDLGPISVNGDTGLSAGIKTQLEAIKGLPRAIPIFTEVSGPGNNATYTIVKFVGIRILDVKLTGGTKYVIVQSAPVVDSTVIPGEVAFTTDAIFSTPKLIRNEE